MFESADSLTESRDTTASHTSCRIKNKGVIIQARAVKHAQTHKKAYGPHGARSTGGRPFWVERAFGAIFARVTGFKLGQVTLQSWGTKSCTNLSQTLKGVAVAKPQSSTTGHCSPWRTEMLITPTNFVQSTPNFIGCTWAPPRMGCTWAPPRMYTCAQIYTGS